MTTTTSDPYAVLGVPKDATVAAIRSAHRKLVLQTHPDKIQDESLRAIKQDEFQRIQQAYEILTDENSRREYDEKVSFAAADKRDYFGDRFRTTDGGVRVEVRTAAPPRDFDAVYEERRPSRRSDDEEILSAGGGRRDFRAYEERVTAKVYDGGERRRTSRGLDDQRRAARHAEEEYDRIRLHRDRERQSEREHQSERRRTRARERQRGYDQKYYGHDVYEIDLDLDNDVDDDDLAVPRVSIRIDQDLGARPRKKSSEARRSDEVMTPRRQPFVRRTSDDPTDTHRKLSLAREYMDVSGGGSMRTPRLHRSTTTAATATAAPPPPPPPQPATVMTSGSSSTAYEVRPISPPLEEEIVVDAVRRSSAPRRSADRDHRGSRRSRPSRRESTWDHIEIVEPATPEYEPRSSSRGTVPSMVHSASSPANIRIPSASVRGTPTAHRSATMQSTREVRPEPPSLPRSTTMPSAALGSSSSRRRDRDREPYSAGSSRLKPTVTEIDSGYSSPGTPETPSARPGKSPTRHASEYIVIEDLEPRYPRESSGRHRKVTAETSDLGYDRRDRERERERSVSPHGRSARYFEDGPVRPSLAGRASTSAKLSPNTRTTSYVFSRKDGSSTRLEPSSSPAAATTPFLRRETSANVSSSRGSPASSSSTVRPDLAGSGSPSASRARPLFGEVQYSPRITPEQIRYSESRAPPSSRDRSSSHHHRRGTSSSTAEAVYRDAAPPRSRSHYLHGPHSGLMRAETSM